MQDHTPHIKSKLPATGTTIFTIMSNMANEHNAINLSQGFPDFPPSDKLLDLVYHHIKNGKNQYAPMQGILSLREKLAQKAEDLYKIKLNPETEINITSGGTEAIYAAISASINEGDEVIVFEPAYDCYVPAIQLNGGIPIFIPLEFPDYHINWDLVKNRINGKTRMIIINSPQNPTGTVLLSEDMKMLEKLTANTDILILSDEVYEHVIFDEIEHESILKYPKLFERSFVVFSFGKTYHNTGWKMGYCMAPENLMKEFRKVHQYIVFSSPTPFQYAFNDILDQKDYYMELNAFYQEKRDYFQQIMKGSKFKLLDCKGSYFQLAVYNKISEEGDVLFAERLTKEGGVASIPISVFYSRKTDNKVIRFCFAKSKEILEQAAERLNKF